MPRYAFVSVFAVQFSVYRPLEYSLDGRGREPLFTPDDRVDGQVPQPAANHAALEQLPGAQVAHDLQQHVIGQRGELKLTNT